MPKTVIDLTTYNLALQSVKDGLTRRQASELHNIKYKTLTSYISKRLHNSSDMSTNTNRKVQKSKMIKLGSQELSPENAKVCVFCKLPDEREAEFGKFHMKRKVSVHYYCLLFSCALEQNGEDDEGILGFLQRDILKEVQRGRKLKCIYCMKTGATVGCNSKCRAAYHFPCGLDNSAQYVFSDDFSSFCKDHREYQKKISITKADCPICLDPVKREPLHSIYPPCCNKAWFHKICLQKLALSAGYFFKCPLCNDKTVFVKDMLRLGVYVPETDASWEKEPNAFADLLERPIHCDATKCVCVHGRDYDGQETSLEIILCSLCGSTGTHIRCAKLKLQDPKWECSQCKQMLQSSKRSPDRQKMLQVTDKFTGSFYPRKRKRTTRNSNSVGESSGLSNQSLCKSLLEQGEKNTLPSIEEMNNFASDIPASLLDSNLQECLKNIVPNCQLNLFGNTILQFCNSSLKEIQMLVLYQIYKPFSLWLNLKQNCSSDVDMPLHGRKSDNVVKMEKLAKLVEERVMEANGSFMMQEFKMSADCDEEAGTASEVIRIEREIHMTVDEQCAWCRIQLETNEFPTSVNLKTGDLTIICLNCKTSNLMKNAFWFLNTPKS